MSLFDTLLGNSSHANTNTNATQNTSQVEDKTTATTSNQNTQQQQTSNQTQQTQSNTQQTNQSQATGQNVTSTLDAGTIATLKNVLSSLTTQSAAGDAQGNINQIAQTLIQNSQKPAVSAQDIAGEQSAAVTSFNQNEAPEIARLQNTIGSKNNTYSALVQQKGQQDLSSTLAGIVANADTTNAQVQQQQLQAAVSALTSGAGIGAQDVQNILGVVSALKGAQTTEDTSQGITGSTSQNTNSTTIQQLIDALTGQTNQTVNSDEQTGATGSVASSTNTAGSEGSGLLGWLF